jgi:4-amino-4-deoxy-L-arabinose transferase-like glycosyltransferase
MAPSPTQPRLGALAATVAAAALALVAFRLGRAPLLEPDEGRYAAVAAEMLHSGDLVVPHLLGLPYLEKPPLVPWLTAGAMRVLGESELAARVVPAISSLLALAAAAWLAGRLAGRRAALCAVAALALAPLHAALARTLTIDMTFGALVALGLASYVEATRGRHRSAIFGMYAFGALAALAKGPAAVVLIAGPVAIDVALSREILARVRALRLVAGAALFLAIAAPWYVIVERRIPGAAWFFLYEENVLRFATDRSNRNGHIWFFVPVVLGGFSPAIFFAFGPAREALRAIRARRETAARFPLIVAAFGFTFFSLSYSQLATYMTPIAPALAALAGIGLDEFVERGTGRRGSLLGGLLATGGAIGIAVVVAFRAGALEIPTDLPEEGLPWIAGMGVALVLLGAASIALFARERRGAGLAALGGGMVAALFLSLVGLESVADLLSLRPFAADLRARPPGALLVTYWDHDPGTEVYAGGEIVHCTAVQPIGSDFWSCERFGGADAARILRRGDEAVAALAFEQRPVYFLLATKHRAHLEQTLGRPLIQIRRVGKRELLLLDRVSSARRP